MSLCGLALTFLLTGCEAKTDNDQRLANVTNTTVGNNVQSVQTPALVNTNVDHTIDFNGKKIKLIATYGLDKRYAHNWYFTGNENVNLSIKPQSDNGDITLGVQNVYADVSISSKYQRFDSVRQDSVNMSYSDLPNGMVTITKNNNFTLPFEVESINANQTSFYMINGYGESKTQRLLESDIRKYVDGAKLNVIWTIGIKDSSNNMYIKTIRDSIGIPYNK